MSVGSGFHAFTAHYVGDDWVRTGTTIWPPPTAHTRDGRMLAELTFAQLHHCKLPLHDLGYVERSRELELYRKNPRPPAFASYWTGPEEGWSPCRVG